MNPEKREMSEFETLANTVRTLGRNLGRADVMEAADFIDSVVTAIRDQPNGIERERAKQLVSDAAKYPLASAAALARLERIEALLNEW